MINQGYMRFMNKWNYMWVLLNYSILSMHELDDSYTRYVMHHVHMDGEPIGEPR